MQIAPSSMRDQVGGAVSSLGAPLVSALAQGLGAIQILLLARGGILGEATDAYFFLFVLALLPSQVVIAGVVYPLLLNQGSGAPKGMTRFRWIVPLLSVAAVGAGCGVLALTGRFATGFVALAVLSAVNGAVSTLLWFDTMWLAAQGRGGWNAGITLAANLAACVVLIIPWHPAELRVAIMTGALVVGNGVYLLILIRRFHPLEVPESETADARASSSWWFLARSSSGYASGAILQGLALSLPASGVSTVSILSRFVGSTTTTVVNAILPRFIHSNSNDAEPAFTFLAWLMYPLVVLFVGASVVFAVVDNRIVMYVCLGLGWIVATSMNTIVARLTYRFLTASAAAVVLVPLAIVLVGSGLIAWMGHLTLPIVLLAFIAIDMLSGMLMAHLLKRDRFAVLGGATLAVCVLVALR